MFSSLLNPALILISLSTATSVFVHDTHIDRATAVNLALPAVVANYESNNKLINFSTDLHIHAEQAISDLKTPSLRLQARLNEDKKHLLQKYVTRGHHAFDNYNLPLV